MASTIKEILQNFCYRVNNPAPTAFVGVSSPAERQYLSLFQFIGDELRNRPMAWPQLKRTYTFNTQTDVTRYQLPGDFYRILDSSQWDVTNQWPLRGPISDANMNLRQFAVVSLQTRKAFRLIGPNNYLYSTSPYSQVSQGWFEIDPAGANNTDELFLGYISCNWIWPRNWVASTVYAAATIRSGVGYVYRTAAGGTSGATRPTGTAASVSDGGITDWAVYREPYLCNAANTNLNDDDICLFDEDIMIEGMRWAYKRAKGLDYQQERADWESQVKSGYSRFQAPRRINLSDEQYFDEEWPYSPPGSWSV